MTSYHERHVAVTYRDETFKYYPGKATPRFARECRKALGFGPQAMWASLFQGAFEVDQAATLLWAARWQAMELLGMPDAGLTLEQVDALVDADGALNDFTIEFVGFVRDEDVPDVVDTAKVDEDGTLEVPADPEP